MNYAVVMAGGTGKRLWPLSRKQRPKQVLKLVEGKSLLECCLDRLTPVFDQDRVFVLTNAAYVDTVRAHVPGVPAHHVIAEPCVRDTAGAIGLAAAILDRQDPHATMVVVTADQIINPASALQEAVQDAIHYVDAHPDALVTFGIQPGSPSTQYGYIKWGATQNIPSLKHPICRVEAFEEKPNLQTAQAYVKNGRYAWNAGMFVWKAGTILARLNEFLPAAGEPLQRLAAAWGNEPWLQQLQTWFPHLPRISIDYAVMEKARDVHMIRLACDWVDMGSFDAMIRIVGSDTNRNVVAARSRMLLDCRDTIIVTEEDDHLIAGIGLNHMIVAHSRDATLICPVNQAGRLKELLEKMEKHGYEAHL